MMAWHFTIIARTATRSESFVSADDVEAVMTRASLRLSAGLIATAWLMSVVPTLHAVQSGTDIAVGKLETERVEAVLHGDRAVLDRIFADDLSYVHASGRVDTKATMLASIESGRMKYKKFDRSDVRVRSYRDTAIVTGKAAVDVDVEKNSLVLNILFTAVYVKQPDGAWRMVAWQSTKLPE
jgi:ketosteroid isomerase-like protein